jgi:hypothetical protein
MANNFDNAFQTAFHELASVPQATDCGQSDTSSSYAPSFHSSGTPGEAGGRLGEQFRDVVRGRIFTHFPSIYILCR